MCLSIYSKALLFSYFPHFGADLAAFKAVCLLHSFLFTQECIRMYTHAHAYTQNHSLPISPWERYLERHPADHVANNNFMLLPSCGFDSIIFIKKFMNHYFRKKAQVVILISEAIPTMGY